MKITIDGRRYDLASMVALGCGTRERSGISITDMYFGRTSHRIITETYSIWENRETHGVIGTRYNVEDPGSDLWVIEMTRALELCDQEHREMLESALEKHAPALQD